MSRLHTTLKHNIQLNGIYPTPMSLDTGSFPVQTTCPVKHNRTAISKALTAVRLTIQIFLVATPWLLIPLPTFRSTTVPSYVGWSNTLLGLWPWRQRYYDSWKRRWDLNLRDRSHPANMHCRSAPNVAWRLALLFVVVLWRETAETSLAVKCIKPVNHNRTAIFKELTAVRLTIQIFLDATPWLLIPLPTFRSTTVPSYVGWSNTLLGLWPWPQRYYDSWKRR